MKKWWSNIVDKTKEVQLDRGMRERAMKALAGFLTVMVFFTFLSRGANAVTIPRVVTDTAEQKNIVHKVMVSGYFTKNKEIPVTVSSGILIKSVEAENGSKIKKGDILMYLDTEDLEEKILAVELDVEKLRLSIQDAARNRQLENQAKSNELNRAREDYNTAQKRGGEKINTAKKNMEETKQKLDHLKRNKPEKKPPEAAAEGEDESEPREDTYEAEVNAWKEQKEQLEALYQEQKTLYQDAVNNKEDSMKENKRKMEDAGTGTQADSTKEQLEKEKELKEKELAKLKKLKKKKGIIKSPADGTITEAAAITGDITPETKSFLISDDSQGIKFTAQITKEEQKNISTGEEAVIILSDGEEIEGLQVESITVSEEDPEILNLSVLLEAREDIHLMDQAELKIEKSSKAYGVCVPVEALREEDNKKYLLVVRETETALGKELEVVQQEVEVIDKNESYAALQESGIQGDEPFIIDSDKAVEAGDKVRLQEE